MQSYLPLKRLITSKKCTYNIPSPNPRPNTPPKPYQSHVRLKSSTASITSSMEQPQPTHHVLSALMRARDTQSRFKLRTNLPATRQPVRTLKLDRELATRNSGWTRCGVHAGLHTNTSIARPTTSRMAGHLGLDRIRPKDKRCVYAGTRVAEDRYVFQ